MHARLPENDLNQCRLMLVQQQLRQCNMRQRVGAWLYVNLIPVMHAVVTRSCNVIENSYPVYLAYTSCTNLVGLGAWTHTCRYSLNKATSIIIHNLAVVELRKRLEADAFPPRSHPWRKESPSSETGQKSAVRRHLCARQTAVQHRRYPHRICGVNSCYLIISVETRHHSLLHYRAISNV